MHAGHDAAQRGESERAPLSRQSRVGWWVAPILLFAGCTGCCGAAQLESTVGAVVGVLSIAAQVVGIGAFAAGFDDLTRRRPTVPWERWSNGEYRSPIAAVRREVNRRGGIWVLMLVSLGLISVCAWQPVLLFLAFPGTWLAARLVVGETRGRSFVVWTRVPYVPGEPVEVRFGLDDGASAMSRARYELTCIREVPWPRTGLALGVTRETVWRQTAAHAPEHAPEAGSEVLVRFDPPAGLPDTDIRRMWRVFWEFRVVAEQSSAAYDETFLLPVWYPAPTARARERRRRLAARGRP